MKIRILTVGKIKEKFYRDAIAEYQKRLGRYCKLEIVEVADEKTDENASPSQMEQVKEKEGQRLLSHIRTENTVSCSPLKAKSWIAWRFPSRLTA